MRLGVLLGLGLAGLGLAGCEFREVYRRSETAPRAWDLAWLVPVDEGGRPFVSRSRLFQAGAAAVELEPGEVAYVVVGLSVDALPPSHRRRLDLEALSGSTLASPTADRLRIDEHAGLVAQGTRLELDVDPARPYFDVLGPKWTEDGRAQTSTTGLQLAARLPVSRDACRPVDMVEVTPGHDPVATGLDRRAPLSLHHLNDGAVLAAMRLRGEATDLNTTALVRVRLGQPLTPDDVFVLPSVRANAGDLEYLRQVLVRPAPTAGASAVWVLRHRDWTDPGAQQRKQLGFLELVELPSASSWAALSISGRVEAQGPEWGDFTQAPYSVAEGPGGTLMVVGGRNSGVVPRGYVRVGQTSTAAPSFTEHELYIGGGANQDILYRAVALPEDPRAPEALRFAIGGRRGQISLVGYDPGETRLAALEPEPYAPPPNIMAMVGAGYPRMYAVPHRDGFELWAVGFQGLLARRTTRGDWENLTNRIESEVLFDETVRPCTPLGYPDGRWVLDVARRPGSALLTLDSCAGAVLIRFDAEDRPQCATSVRPPGAAELRVDGKNDFEAVLALEDGYLVASRGGFRLMKVED